MELNPRKAANRKPALTPQRASILELQDTCCKASRKRALESDRRDMLADASLNVAPGLRRFASPLAASPA